MDCRCILHSTIKSRRSFLLAPAHPGGPGKGALKRLWCLLAGVGSTCILQLLTNVVVAVGCEATVCLAEYVVFRQTDDGSVHTERCGSTSSVQSTPLLHLSPSTRLTDKRVSQPANGSIVRPHAAPTALAFTVNGRQRLVTTNGRWRGALIPSVGSLV